MPYTRISEYKHLTGQEAPVTTITYEYPSAEGDPYYPIPRPENQELFKRYEALADATDDVTFVGRLATYRYYNMDQIVGQALATFRRMDEKRQPGSGRSRLRSLPNDRWPRAGRRRWSCGAASNVLSSASATNIATRSSTRAIPPASDDIDAMAELGVKAVRYPILWETVAPEIADELDFSWHDERLERIRRLGHQGHRRALCTTGRARGTPACSIRAFPTCSPNYARQGRTALSLDRPCGRL